MALTIEYLAVDPARLREVATLHYGEWPMPKLGDSIDAREQKLSVCCQRAAMPRAVIALDQNDLCGVALLVPQDFELRPNLSPWLAGVFARPQHRNRGVGSALVERIDQDTSFYRRSRQVSQLRLGVARPLELGDGTIHGGRQLCRGGCAFSCQFSRRGGRGDCGTEVCG
jgi:GNAT superfamily N-acetyltransferase